MKNLCKLILNRKIINKGLKFYNIDKKYKEQANNCLQEVLNDDFLKQKFIDVFEMLYVKNTDLSSLWNIKNVDLLFEKSVNPFITNLMILTGGVIFHKNNMKKMKFDKKQISSHKLRVKECFVNDLEIRNYRGVRLSQLLWATYFINCRIIEVGILQYEYDSSINKIKIHIPRLPSLDFSLVQKSLAESKIKVEKFFHIKNISYICNSWLLCKQLSKLLKESSNIKKFQTLFNIKNGKDCVSDILNFAFNLNACNDFASLPEKTSLQKAIKKELIKGTNFKLGVGELI